MSNNLCDLLWAWLIVSISLLLMLLAGLWSSRLPSLLRRAIALEDIEEVAKRIFETEIAFGDYFQYKRDQPYELRWEQAKEQNLFCYRLAMAQAKAALKIEAPPP